MTSFSVGTSEKIKENHEDLLKNKPDGKLIHAGTNGITNGVNLLNSEIVKQDSDISPRITAAFSSIIVRKDNTNAENTLTDTNISLKSYCLQIGISFVENSNIQESHLNKKKLRLSKTGKSFAKTVINCIKNLA